MWKGVTADSFGSSRLRSGRSCDGIGERWRLGCGREEGGGRRVLAAF